MPTRQERAAVPVRSAGASAVEAEGLSVVAKPTLSTRGLTATFPLVAKPMLSKLGLVATRFWDSLRI